MFDLLGWPQDRGIPTANENAIPIPSFATDNMQDNSSNFSQCDHAKDAVASAQNKQEAQYFLSFFLFLVDPALF